MFGALVRFYSLLWIKIVRVHQPWSNLYIFSLVLLFLNYLKITPLTRAKISFDYHVLSKLKNQTRSRQQRNFSQTSHSNPPSIPSRISNPPQRTKMKANQKAEQRTKQQLINLPFRDCIWQWFSFPVNIVHASITVGNALSCRPTGSVLVLFKHWTLVAQCHPTIKATIFCTIKTGAASVFLIREARVHICTESSHLGFEGKVLAAHALRQKNSNRGWNIHYHNWLLFMNLVRRMLRSTFDPESILCRSNRRLQSIRSTESIKTQSVDLNWDKRRTYHALNCWI